MHPKCTQVPCAHSPTPKTLALQSWNSLNSYTVTTLYMTLFCRRNRTGSQFTSTGQAGLPRAAHRMHLGIHLRNVEIKAFEETFQTTQKDTQLQNK